MKVYEFRKDLKRCFDTAVSGDPVYIERGGIVFELTRKGYVTDSMVNMVVKDLSFDKNDIHMVAERLEQAECKNGHLIPEGRRKCNWKGCKYA